MARALRRRFTARLAALGCALALAACGGEQAGAAGYTVDVAVTPSPPVVGPAWVELVLRGPDAAPIAGAEVRLEGTMSHAGMVPVLADAPEARPGVYAGELELTMGGDWILIVTAELPDGEQVELTHALPGVTRGG